VTRPAASRLTIVVPGRLSTLTGGYGYLRRIIAGLRDLGWQVDTVELAGCFPEPDAEALAAAAYVGKAPETAAPLVIDGLALPAFQDVLAELVRQRPVLALIHHPLADETGLDADAAAAFRARETRQLSLVQGVICSSPFTRKELTEDYGVAPDRLACVVPGTDPAAPVPFRRSRSVRMLCVATLTPRKGHRVLLRALKRLPGRSDWRLDLVGSRALDPPTARRLAADRRLLQLRYRVTIHGSLSGAVLERLWRRANLHVLPSFHEGYGMAHAEALRRGLPLIAGDGGATATTVPAGAGLLVSPGNVRSLAVALRQILSSHPRRQLTVRARIAGRQLPTWPMSARAFAAAVTRLSGHAGNQNAAPGSLFQPDWLQARERADAAARDAGLAAAFVGRLVYQNEVGPHLLDLGAGDGNGLRWLAPRIPEPQCWTLVDHDPAGLEAALARTAEWAGSHPGWQVRRQRKSLRIDRGEGGPIAVETLTADLSTGLETLPWSRVGGVSGSALLDLVSEAWLGQLAGLLAQHALPAWFSLTVDGSDRWDPPHPDDAAVFARFSADQRRDKGFGRALGAEATDAAIDRFRAAGLWVKTASSPWHLDAGAGPDAMAVQKALIGFHSDVAGEGSDAWRTARLAEVAAGRLRVTIGHRDVAAWSGPPKTAPRRDR